MTTNLVELFIKYAIAGLIGWIVWFVITVAYVLIVTKADVSTCEKLTMLMTNAPKKRKLVCCGLIWCTIFWPIGMMANAFYAEKILEEAIKANN